MGTKRAIEPQGRFRTIVADPPWPYEKRPGRYPDPRLKRPQAAGPALAMPYLTMSLSEIENLPVSRVAARDAHLYVWATQRFLPAAFQIIESWGFAYATTLVWCKKPKGIHGTWISSTEFVLFCRRGSLKATSKHLGTWFDWPRHEKSDHSRKPDGFLDLVEQVSPGPYLEMFARRARFGWDYWGDESLGTAELMETAHS